MEAVEGEHGPQVRDQTFESTFHDTFDGADMKEISVEHDDFNALLLHTLVSLYFKVCFDLAVEVE